MSEKSGLMTLPHHSCRALLRETAEAPVVKAAGTAKDANVFARNLGLFASEEMSRLGDDLVRDSELALGPAAALPLELLTDMDQLPDPRQSIEVGRRVSQSPALAGNSPLAEAESLRPSLPYSPLRKGTAAGSTLDVAELVPLNELDHDHAMDILEEAPMAIKEGRPSAELPSVAGIEEAVSTKPAKTTAPRTRRQPRGGRLILDEETELSNASVQTLVRNPISLLLPPLDITDATLRACLALFNQQGASNLEMATATLSIVSDKEGAVATEPAADEVERVPLNEDGDYLLGPADYGLDVIEDPHQPVMVSSPKSPRLMAPTEGDENAVPEHNLSIPGTPSKRTTALKLQLTETALDTLEHWQQRLGLEKSLGFAEELLSTSATRRGAAEAFHQLLVFTSKGLVRTEQATPYGNIMVKAMPALFTATAADVAQ